MNWAKLSSRSFQISNVFLQKAFTPRQERLFRHWCSLVNDFFLNYSRSTGCGIIVEIPIRGQSNWFCVVLIFICDPVFDKRRKTENHGHADLSFSLIQNEYELRIKYAYFLLKSFQKIMRDKFMGRGSYIYFRNCHGIFFHEPDLESYSSNVRIQANGISWWVTFVFL